MPRTLHLIPAPKSLAFLPGTFPLPLELFIVLPSSPTGPVLFAAERFVMEAQTLCRTRFPITAGTGLNPKSEIRATLDDALAPELPEEIRNQTYRLAITHDGIQLTARAPAGLFYAFQTLLQILRETVFKSQISNPKNSKLETRNLKLPCLLIADHPDFPRRGVYHDTARGKVPTIDTLLLLIDDLAHLKYNEFQLYIENNFQFRKHPDMYADTTPFTAEELLQLDAACRARHIDFVPSLTSLGHFEKILFRPQYRPLAEAEPAQLKAIGAPCWHEAGPWSLCVTDPKAQQLLSDMYAEFAPNFSSPQFNICCDEAYDLGRVRSQELADKPGSGGTGQMYVDWINFCDQLVKSQPRGIGVPPMSPPRSIQMWGDIILNHPELIAQLPADATLLEWGYEHDHKFDEHCKIFAERLRNDSIQTRNSKLETRNFYVAPGTSSWLTFSARTKNACANIHNAATAGLKHGARGLLITDWGDQGHQQMLAVSLLPFAYGAAAGWNLSTTPNPVENQQSKIENLFHAISLHLFKDPTAHYAALAYDLGLTYERLVWQRTNASLDHFLFREHWDVANYVNRASVANLEQTIAATLKLLEQFDAAALRSSQAGQIRAEFVFTCFTIIHTCQRTLLRQRWLAADPARRNPDETLRIQPPHPLSKDFPRQMETLHAEILTLEEQFTKLWLARNKPSRLADVTAEFQRLAAEYRAFAHPRPRAIAFGQARGEQRPWCHRKGG